MKTPCSITHNGHQIDTVEYIHGFLVRIDGNLLTQFDAPLEPYWFSSAISAQSAAKQQINREQSK